LRYEYGEIYTHTHSLTYDIIYVYMHMYVHTESTAMCARTRARCNEYLRGGTAVAL